MGNGDNFKLGQTNTATATSVLSTRGKGEGLHVLSDAGEAIRGVRNGGGVGVHGIGGIGVFGESKVNPSIAVLGFAAHGVGLSGQGVTGGDVLGGQIGMKAESDAGVGVMALSREGIALFVSAPATGTAALINGQVVVVGSFIVLGGAKSAAVPHPDGSHRLLYCVESPESWFEDFGRGQLVRGRTVVKLDADFAGLVRRDQPYHVFLTPLGDCRGLYVHRTTTKSFEVRELQGGHSDVRFGYRLVAKRKDVPGPRLAKIAVPKAPTVDRSVPRLHPR